MIETRHLKNVAIIFYKQVIIDSVIFQALFDVFVKSINVKSFKTLIHFHFCISSYQPVSQNCSYETMLMADSHL